MWLLFNLEIIPRTISRLDNASRVTFKKHLNKRSMFYFLLQKVFKLIKFITQSYLFIAFELFLLLVLSAFPVFLKSLNNYFFRWLAYKPLLWEFSCYNKLYSVIFQSFFGIHLFPTFFISQVFQGPGFSGPESRVQVQDLGPGFRSKRSKVNLLKPLFCMDVLL